MKKELITTIVALGILVIVGGIYIFNKNSIPTNLEQANVLESVNSQNQDSNLVDLSTIPTPKNFSFTFTGYGPAGKFHDGTFKNYELATSSIIFKANTVSTGIDGLDKHLCAAEFFDCENYSDIKFQAESIVKKSENLYEVSGTLSFKDITKQVIFNANVDGNKVSADFLLDTTEFNFNPKLVENNVRIKFSFEI